MRRMCVSMANSGIPAALMSTNEAVLGPTPRMERR